MSLVAYDYSDEDSDQEESVSDEQMNKPSIMQKMTSDELVIAVSHNPSGTEEESTLHIALPVPKKITEVNLEEEDDEFLRKKAIPEIKPPLPTIRPKVKNGKVQITIPSMKDFKDENKKPSKPVIGAELSKKQTGLLSILPKPKSGSMVTPIPNPSTAPAKPICSRLIPDAVAKRPKNNPETKFPKKPVKKNESVKSIENDSDASDDEEKLDFFSLCTDDKLPEISANEINAMVAKRAARMAEAAKKFIHSDEPEEQPGTSHIQLAEDSMSHQINDGLTNERALSSLIGGNKAKRARVDAVKIIDISSSDIVPTKEDFLRRKLQDETGYVPTGHLVGDWSCTSKRKSHITHLASKAQANSQELEAMWASNRQSRRQTQSKYGF
ncbi:uncharacterized protein LOC129768627 [Toxorhynchites rutilus septentrionalis]|uniref:uncharacterized protein LOC129768627 n=1 Tax=Toxorhynchites rutilus septentrionalis TaxID=329112 RepID=UPI00247B24DE|nr:uncharacterized protein LOC129768627 [Toxorhynchites rutilus septentrionalis]